MLDTFVNTFPTTSSRILHRHASMFDHKIQKDYKGGIPQN